MSAPSVSAALRLAWLLLAATSSVDAQPEPAGAGLVDRVAARFSAPELGGVESPRFIFERELAFEARLESLSERSRGRQSQVGYDESHLRAALERHVAETILEALQITPPPTPEAIRQRVAEAQLALAERVGGMQLLTEAARAEGLEQRDVFRLLQRQARASLYLDRMVAPMLAPSEAELQGLHRAGRTPFRGQSYDEHKAEIRRWFVSQKLRAAALTYYEGARARLSLYILQ